MFTLEDLAEHFSDELIELGNKLKKIQYGTPLHDSDGNEISINDKETLCKFLVFEIGDLMNAALKIK